MSQTRFQSKAKFRKSRQNAIGDALNDVSGAAKPPALLLKVLLFDTEPLLHGAPGLAVQLALNVCSDDCVIIRPPVSEWPIVASVEKPMDIPSG